MMIFALVLLVCVCTAKTIWSGMLRTPTTMEVTKPGRRDTNGAQGFFQMWFPRLISGI